MHKIFDDPDNQWGESKEPSIWDDSNPIEPEQETKTVKIKFRFNPKLAAIAVVGIVALAILASVTGAAQLAVAASQPIPKFKEGKIMICRNRTECRHDRPACRK